MTDSNISFLGRISLAVGTFFAVLGDGELAAGVRRLRKGERPAAAPAPVAPPVPAPAPVAPAPALKEASPVAALQLLGLLQRDARLSISSRKTSRASPMPRSAPPRVSCTTVAAPYCASISRSARAR